MDEVFITEPGSYPVTIGKEDIKFIILKLNVLMTDVFTVRATLIILWLKPVANVQ